MSSLSHVLPIHHYLLVLFILCILISHLILDYLVMHLPLEQL